MLTSRSHVVGLVSTLALFGCGGSNDGPAAKPGQTNPAGAKAVITQTTQLQTALMANDGASLSGTVNSLAISGAQQIVSPAVGKALTALAQAQTADPGTSGGVMCDANG